MAGTYRCECPTGYSLLPNQHDCATGGNMFYVQLQIMSRVITFITTTIKMRIILINNTPGVKKEWPRTKQALLKKM